MKNLRFFKTLLIAIGLLAMSINQANAVDRRIYCNISDVSSWWGTGFVYAWNNSGSARYSMTDGGGNVLFCDIDDSYTKIIFYRSNKKEDDGSAWWNQSVDVTIGDNNYWNLKNTGGDKSKNVDGACRYAPSGAIVGLDGDWNAYKHPMSAGSVSITLEANTTYTFKVLKDFTYYNQSKAYVGQTSALRWTSDGDVACHLTTAGAGSYIFTWDNTNKDLTVTYPTVTHPTTDYVYFKKPGGWGNVKAYIYDSEVVAWGNAPELSTCSFDGTYYYAALGGNSSIIFYNSSNASQKTGNLTDAEDNFGKYYDQTLGTPAWADFKATITLNNHDADIESGTTSVNPVYKTEVLSSITPPQKTNYTFDGYYTGTSGSGSKLINKSGAWQTVAGYTDASKHWIRNSAGSSSITLHANWTQEPAVTITASKTSGINVGETITLTATGSQASNITKYEFYEGSTKIATVNAPTNTYSYTPSTVGAKTVKVVMTYNSGSNTVESDGLDLTLNTPAVALGESSSRTEMWLGVNATNDMTLNATSSNVGSSASVTWTISDAASGTFTQTGAGSYSGKGWTYVPASTGAKTITVTMAVGGQEYTRTYNVTVYERWNIYVHDVQSWGKMSIYSHTSEAHGSWPGTACSKYNSTNSWYTVTLDSKGTKTILNKNGEKDGGNDVKAAEITTGSSSGTYASGTYWYINAFNNGTLTSVSISEPEVEITNCNVYATYALLEGRVTGFGGDGSALSDLKEYGFYLDETKYSGASYVKSTSGTYFRVKISGLTPGTEYAIKAFATNVLYTAYSDVQNKTTSDASRTIGIRYKNATDQTLKIYAYRDISSDYGTETKYNTTWSGATLTRISGTARWREATISNAADYQYFIVSNNGEKQTNNITMPNADACWWYDDTPDDSHKADRSGSMDCPHLTTSVYIEENAGEEDYQYVAMTGSGTMTKAISLAAKSTYKFKIVYQAEYYGKDEATYSRGGSAITGVQDDGYIQITTDAAGDYTFNFNTSTKAISITYPTAYVVTYSAVLRSGSGSYKSGDPSAQATGPIAVTSTDYVLAGKDVTFTAAAANTGYTFHGWFDTDEPTIGTTVPLSSDDDDDSNRFTYTASSIGGAVTVYAVYTEDMHTVTVTVDEHGTITTPFGGSGSTVSAGISTTASVAASAAYGYVFNGWTVESGSATFANDEALSTTINATADATIKANFFPHWTIAGGDSDKSDGDDAMGNWNLYTNGIDGFEQISLKWHGYSTISLPANSTFYFKIYDHTGSPDWYGNPGTMDYGNHTDWTMTKDAGNCTFETAGAGNYEFDWNETDKKLTVTYPTSWTVTYNVSTFYDEDRSHDYDNTTGGTITYAKDNDSITLTSGKYVKNGGTMTFKATPAAGYTFAGWYKDQACSSKYTSGSDGAVITDGVLELTIEDNNKTVYAKFQEIMTMVSISTYTRGTFKIDDGSAVAETTYPHIKVGVHTTHRVTIMSEGESYYFSGWELSPSFSCEEAGKAVNFSLSGTGEDDRTNVIIRGLGDPDKCQGIQFLRANFDDLDQIYFRNVFDDGTNPKWSWDNVYAFFDVSWNSGSHCAVTSANNSSKGLHVQMSAIGSTGIYRAYVPRYVTRNNIASVAFADYDVSDNSAVFNPGSGTNHGSCRSDYNTKHNMFVPYHVKETYDGYYTQYYNSGYWMHYTITEGVNAGYWIEERKLAGQYSGKPSDQFVVLNRAYDKKPQIRYRLRIDGTSDKNYAIFSEGGIKYKASSTIAYNNCDNITLTEDNGSDAYFTIRPTAEGEYILTIDQSGDQMKLSVEYPIVAGDYVLEHTYTGRNKADDDDSTYVTRTNVIKSADAGTKTRYSMYLNKADATLKLRKCTGITDGVPVWNDGSTTKNAYILDTLTKYGNGVYQFDLTIVNDELSAVDSTCLYTGNFYIKTDAAPGGWVGYKRNILAKNTVSFDRSNASTFDNYFCAYYASKDNNIKSVIANDYCNQLSDTMKGDGIARMYKGEPYVPINGTSIRFSYNSATNVTKRAYLEASEHNGFLNIVPNTNNNIYRSITVGEVTTKYDLYDEWTGSNDSAKCKFVDNENWVYEMDLSVIPGAQAGVRAAYYDGTTKHQQMLIPADNVLLAADVASSTEYGIRVVYDFKTNYMMSAFVLTEDLTIDENLEDFDMLWIRHIDDSPTQLTLGDGKTLSHVRPIGAIEFRYDEMCSSAAGSVDLSGWTEDSRPYLKYFISFPFDVHVGSVFGLNDAYYGLDYVIQKYDGATRAADGLFAGDGDNYWINLTKDSIMHANEGYCLILDNDYARWNGSSDMWYKKKAGGKAYIYFPAMEEIESIGSSETAVTKVPQHECKVDRAWAGSKSYLNHMQTDSHWNLIGQPFFHDAYMKSSSDAIDTLHLASYYYLDYSDNKWHIQAFDKDHHIIKAMSSFFVQWAGDITWTLNAVDDKWKDTPVAAAPSRANTEVGKNYLIKLDVEFNGKVSDWAFVRLEDHANDDFVLREDMFKMYNNGIPNIYTFAGAYDAAYNAVPVKNQTIRMGVIIRKNGTYKFSMPSDFSGTVTLIDKVAQTRTNLALDDYTVDLTKGTINDRFELEINIYNAPTAIDGASDGSGSLKDGKAHKFIMNDMLYILKDGVIYDARGARVR